MTHLFKHFDEVFSLFSLLQSWDVYFRNVNAEVPPGAAHQRPPSLGEPPQGLTGVQTLVGVQPNVEELVADHLAVQSLVRAYQVKFNHVIL